LVARQRHVRELPANRSKVGVFLVRSPGFSRVRQEGNQVLRRILVRRVNGGERVIVIQDAKIRAGFGPEIVGLRRMNMRVVAAGSGQNIVVVGGIGDLLTNVDDLAVYDCKRGPAYQTVDE